MNRFERVAYDLGQATRVAWFYAHAELASRLAPPILEPPEVDSPMPTVQQMMADLLELFRRDRANIEAGLYRLPYDLFGSPFRAAALSLRFLSDLGRIDRRRRERIHDEVRSGPGGRTARLPGYYAQNFHFQTDGYLSEGSAKLYDVQVETLFYGAAAPMRRSALRPIAEYLKGSDQRQVALIDVACGTGRLLRQVRLAFPAIQAKGIDLSEAYLGEAERHLRGLRAVDLIAGNAEALPLADASQDIATCVFLYHELPPTVRRRVTAEIARVLKPGGLFVFIDSLQMGDRPGWDGLLEAFPERFHEPYYRHYAIDDVEGMFTAAGLMPEKTELAFLSKVMVRRKA